MEYEIITRHQPYIKQQIAAELRHNMTPAELTLWQALKSKKHQGLRFRRQQPMFGFIADFYCHELRLVIEVDGEVHDANHEYDNARDEILNAHGIRVLRFKNRQVINELSKVLASIEAVR
jgi:very-short-patch-repair endonuclease